VILPRKLPLIRSGKQRLATRPPKAWYILVVTNPNVPFRKFALSQLFSVWSRNEHDVGKNAEICPFELEAGARSAGENAGKPFMNEVHHCCGCARCSFPTPQTNAFSYRFQPDGFGFRRRGQKLKFFQFSFAPMSLSAIECFFERRAGDQNHYEMCRTDSRRIEYRMHSLLKSATRTAFLFRVSHTTIL